MDVITSEPRFASPDVQLFVPTCTVDELVARADQELSELEARAIAEVAHAERLEAALEAEGADPHLGPWAMVELHTFLDRLLLELSAELRASIEVARLAPRVVQRAPVEDAPEVLTTEPAAEPIASSRAVWAKPRDSSKADALGWDNNDANVEVPAESRDVSPPPFSVLAPVVNEAPPNAETTAQDPDSTDWDELSIDEGDTPDIEAIASAPPDQQFWADQQPAPGRSLFSRRRAAVALQISAGLLVVGAVVLHFA